ncbi:D-cysteine desulfhydrase family protein [Sphingomonas sp.]|uniref:D-cysteine desulfhydrase family protein n=1 Tax=Sphingomonas sp. TaxID=28214 RepID=UPI0025F24315|nr:D-cysteine desulfhydrase family protein [Sphingomonas sp.]
MTSATLEARLAALPRVRFLPWATPIEPQPGLSRLLGIDLLIKRDDLTGLAFGGNKVRQLEFYFGKAIAEGADTALITGAVQSNYVRVAAACAARLGMHCHIQLEERVSGVDQTYRSSGNVLLSRLLGAVLHSYPAGEDEEGADRRLGEIAAELEREGRRPFVIPLGAGQPPTGALGYVCCALELLGQARDFDRVVIASGSGHSHAGLLFGLRFLGWRGPVHGMCVRRGAALQQERILRHCSQLSVIVGDGATIGPEDVLLHDDVLSPGYGVVNPEVERAIRACASLDGLLVDPVYTGRAMAGLMHCVADGTITSGDRVLFVHTGGLPALFGYARDLGPLLTPRDGAFLSAGRSGPPLPMGAASR